MTGREDDRGRRKADTWLVSLLLPIMAAFPAAARTPDDYYTEPQVYGMRPHPTREFELGPIGPTGIEARIFPGVLVTVERTQPGTPAEGKFHKGDIIVGVNGVALKGKNPMVVLGNALTAAEAADGVLAFDVKPGQDGAVKKVTVKIPVLGAYSETFPVGSAKSRTIIKRAAAFYARPDRLKRHWFLNGLACLFLLSTGDDAYLPRVKQYFAQFLKDPDGWGKTTWDDGVKGVGDMSWDNGYNGIACAEYYLRTGDKSVLPLLQYYCDDAMRRQHWGKGWQHWGYGINPGYEGAGGLINSAGTQILTTLLLGKECGVKVDDKTLRGALTFFYHYAGHGAVPLTDTRNWFILRSGGRDGGTAGAMQIACGAQGDVTIYRQARDYLAASALTSWPSRGHVWEVIWHSLVSHLTRDRNAERYYRTMRRFQWCFDLHRQASGGFWFHRTHPSVDPVESGVALALAYTAPLKTLRITGAPRSKHARDFTLPSRLWGTKADDAFLSTKNNPGFDKYGEYEEIHIPHRELPTQLRPNDVSKLPLDMMRKNVRHWRYVIRLAAAKALRMNKRLDELEKLLRDPDPRLRRAGLDGIIDYKPWCGSLPWGPKALKPDEYTPAMIQAITDILADANEAWFVTDGALLALYDAPVDAVKKNIPRILPWIEHEEWWLREAAFSALLGLAQDDALLLSHMPTLIDAYVKEYFANPNINMRKMLCQTLERKGNDSPVGKAIIAGLVRAVLESEIRPDVGKRRRSQEGAYNVVQAALACTKLAPEAAPELAEAIVRGGRFGTLDTTSLLKILQAPDGHLHDRFVGLVPALATLPPRQKKRLADTLYNDFRPELIRRYGSVTVWDEADLLDRLIDLARLKKDVAGWRPVGAPKPAARAWRYCTFDPLTDKDKVHPRTFERFRRAALPEGLEHWYRPDFDDSQWKKGPAPIGVGEFIAHGHGRMWTATPDHFFKNNSDWGHGEFILMRTTFDVDDLDCDEYRINILTARGYTIYLNGHEIKSYPWTAHYPEHVKAMLTDPVKRRLKKGANTLAVYGMLGYHQDAKTGEYHPIGQMDVWIEGLRKSDLGLNN
jgi:hypothetical protein